MDTIKPIQASSEKDVNLTSTITVTPVLPILLEPQADAPVKRKRGRPRTVRPLSIDEPQINSNDSSIAHTESTEHSNSSDNILQLVEIINDDNTVELSADDSSSKPYELVHVVDCSSQSQDLINATNADDSHLERSASPASLDGITIERHSDDTYLVTVDSSNDENSKKRLNSYDDKIYVEVSESLDSQEIVEVKEVIYDSLSQNSSLYNLGDVYGFEEQQAVHKLCETVTQPKSFEGAFSGIRKSKRLTSVKFENEAIDEESATNKTASTEDCKEIIKIPEMSATDAVSLAVLQLNQLESTIDSSKANKKSKKIQSAVRSKKITRYDSSATFADTRTIFTPSKSPLHLSETPVRSEILPDATLITTEHSQLNATPVSVATESAEIATTEPIPERSSAAVDKLKRTPPRSSSLKLQAQISTTFDILLKKSRPENGSSTALIKTIESPSTVNPSLENPDICGLPSPSLENRDNPNKISVSRPASPVRLKKIPKRSVDPLNILPKPNLSKENPIDTSSIIALPSSSVENRDNKIENIPVSRSSSPNKLKTTPKRSDDSLNVPPIQRSKIDFSEELDKLAMKDRQSISRKRRTDAERDISVKKSKKKSRTETGNALPPVDRKHSPVCDSKLSVPKTTDKKRNKASHIEKALLESGSYDPIDPKNCSVDTICEIRPSSPSIPTVSEAPINYNPQSDAYSINSEVSVNIPTKGSTAKDAELALNLLKQLQEPISPKPIVKTKGSLKLLVDPKISIDSHSRDSTRKDKSKRKQAKLERSSKKGTKVKSKKHSSHSATDSPAELSETVNFPVDEASPLQFAEVNVRKNAKLKCTRWGKIDTSTEPDILSNFSCLCLPNFELNLFYFKVQTSVTTDINSLA